jgi:hypothetical protein
MPDEDRVISLPYETDPRAVAKIIASCDAIAIILFGHIVASLHIVSNS